MKILMAAAILLASGLDAAPPPDATPESVRLDPRRLTARSVFLAALESLEQVPAPRRLDALERFLEDAHRDLLADGAAPAVVLERRRLLLLGLGALFDASDLLGQIPWTRQAFDGVVDPSERRRRAWMCESVLLNGRSDAGKHFFISAALTAVVGPALADRVGRNKEIRDARRLSEHGGGQGFSFVDLAHNHAGIRYAAWILGEGDDQRSRRPPPAIRVFCTDFSGVPLPEGLDWKTLQQRFLGRHRAAYRDLIAAIHDAIDAALESNSAGAGRDDSSG